MKIGIVSDSHGKIRRLNAALELFARHGVTTIVHCGDVGSVECVRLMGSSGVAVYMVAGNLDHRIDKLMQSARNCGVKFSPKQVEVPLGDGRYLVATHGDDEDLLDELIAGGQFPYICHGHTHRAKDEVLGKVRIINPGALYNCRCPRHPTVGILDLETGELEHLEVPR